MNGSISAVIALCSALYVAGSTSSLLVRLRNLTTFSKNFDSRLTECEELVAKLALSARMRRVRQHLDAASGPACGGDPPSFETPDAFRRRINVEIAAGRVSAIPNHRPRV